MQSETITEKRQRPDVLYVGKPTFYYVANLEVGQQGEGDNIRVDALRIQNFNAPAQLYYEDLIKKQKAKPGYEKIQAMVFQNNATTMFVAIDDHGRVSVYITPSEEFDRTEQEHVQDLISKGIIYPGGSSEWVPFSSTGSDSPENVAAYKDSLFNFNKNSNVFRKSQLKAA